MFRITASSSTPVRVLRIEPSPPVSSVPPTTTAAMAINSQPAPSVGEPQVCPPHTTPPKPPPPARALGREPRGLRGQQDTGQAGQGTRQCVDRDLDPLYRQAHQTRGFLVA